jgi:hypothetical protein
MAADEEFEYEVQGYYGSIYGWECLTHYPGTPAGRGDALAERKVYDAEEPEHPHRVKKIKK